MSELIDRYLRHVGTAKRYSERTQAIYRDVLSGFHSFVSEGEDCSDDVFVTCLKPQLIRSYEVHLLDERNNSPRTVNLHLSVLSGFCKFLMKEGRISSNPVHLVSRPKMEKRLPDFYKDDSMREYFEMTAHSASEDELEVLASFGSDVAGNDTAKEMYERRLRRMIVSLLHGTAIRRSELISLDCCSVDFSRRVMRVRGKGDKVREIPLLAPLCEELSLYQRSVELFLGICESPARALLLTASGRRLYPVYVDRTVKEELGQVRDITGRKSPHVLRHTLATGLLNEGTDLNSIKEFLGHSSLAATQVYTHNSIEKLKKIYTEAHPRAKEK